MPVQETFGASVLGEGSRQHTSKSHLTWVEYCLIDIVKALSGYKSRFAEVVVKVTWESPVVVRLWEKR